MRRRVAIGVALATVLLMSSGLASGEVYRTGNLQLSFDGGFTPESLPRERAVPVTFSVSGRIATTDGSHPPALRHLRLELNRHGRISPTGLPACPPSSLQSTTSGGALARCRPALVGRGSFAAELSGAGNAIPVVGRILIFNSRTAGGSVLLLHFYGTTPIQLSYVVALKIRRSDKGEFGTVLTSRLPKLAGGVGSITRIKLEIGREYTYRGERRGYLSATCAAPDGFGSVPFNVARGSFRFAGGLDMSTTLVRSCRARD